MKKESNLKSKIKELKKTSRGKAILKLIKWCIFFIVLFIFLLIASLIKPEKNNIKNSNQNNSLKTPINNEEKAETKSEETLSKETITEYQNYLSNIYDYNYDIKINNENYIFSGTKTKIDNVGYKESSNGIIKYIIDSTGTYEKTTSTTTPIDNLYENIDEAYIDPLNVLEIIKNLTITRDYECDCIEPVYKTNDSKNIYRISTNNKKITSIRITALDFSYIYTLSFDNIK